MKQARLYFLDNLKTVIIALMIALHWAMCFMAYAPEWWYVVDYEHTHLLFTCVVLWIDVFIMPIMFFISGYFGIATLGKHGYGKWWKGKLLRIVLPWILGVIIFAAPVSYITFYTRNIPLDFWTFCWTLFWNNNGMLEPGVMFSHVQYWYLGMLTLCYIMLTAITKVYPSILESKLVSVQPSKFFIPGVLLFCLANTAITNYYIGNDDLWLHFSYFFVYQPCRVLTYPLFFLTGVYAWRNHWFTTGGYVPNQMIWFSLFVIVSFAYPIWYIMNPFVTSSMEVQKGVLWVLHALLLVSAVFGFLGFCKENLDFTNGVLSRLAANSYTMYYVHMAVLFPIVYLMVPLDLIVWLKAPLVFIVAYIAIYIVGRIFMFLPFFSAGKKALVK